jgi:hypothetical protein
MIELPSWMGRDAMLNSMEAIGFSGVRPVRPGATPFSFLEWVFRRFYNFFGLKS